MKLKKRIAIATASLMLAGCTTASPESDALTVVTSFYPIYDLTRQIAGDNVNVINMMGSGASAHDFEPSIQDRLTMESADIFVYNGAGMESWVDKTLESMNTDSMVVVNTSEFVELIHTEDHDETDHDHDHDEQDHDHDGHDHGDIDPHIWLDPVNAISQSKAILDALISVDPENKDAYTQRFDALKAELDGLDQMMVEGMKTVTNPMVVMNHSAFTYMATRYGFSIESISGIIPDTEPSASQLTAIIDTINEHNISTILMETTSSQKVIDTLVNEVHVEVLMVNTLESVSDGDAVNYVNIMKSNIENLLLAMK